MQPTEYVYRCSECNKWRFRLVIQLAPPDDPYHNNPVLTFECMECKEIATISEIESFILEGGRHA